MLSSLALAILAGCGGGGGSGTDAGAAPSASSTTLSGVASKGPLKGALVTAFPVNAAGVVGSTELAHASTGATGGYSLNLGSYSGLVQLVVSAPNGTVTADEASGRDIALPASFVLHANANVAAPSGNATQSASITPFTELAHTLAQAAGGITAANVASANGQVFALIGVDPVSTRPVASNASDAATGTDAQRRYGLLNAAVSKLATVSPASTDSTVLACIANAGSDAAGRLQCAVQQVATSVTVSGTGSQASFAVNGRIAGLADALVAVAGDANINRTGTTVSTGDSLVKALTPPSTTPTEPTTPTTPTNPTTPTAPTTPVTPAPTDVSVAKAFFAGLRANAAALKSDSIATGVVDGIKGFGDSLQSEAKSVTSHTLDVIDFAHVGSELWQRYAANAAANFSGAANQYSNDWIYCTVYKGPFPSGFGVVGAPYTSAPEQAFRAADAGFIGCSVDSMTSYAGSASSLVTTRYQQVVYMNFAAGPVVPYIATSRKISYTNANGVTTYTNLAPSMAGTASFILANGTVTSFSLAGDLPPAVTASGGLSAQRYAVDIAGTSSIAANGTRTIALTRGSFGVVPVGASTVGLSIDLSAGGGSIAVLPASAADAASRRFTLAAAIADASGRMTGTLTVDKFSRTPAGWVAGHARFDGSLAVAPRVGGVSGSMSTFLEGTLDVADGSSRVISFDGKLSLPGRPVATLTGSVTEGSAQDVLEARYAQEGNTVAVTATRTSLSNATSVSFAGSSGVAVSTTTGAHSSNVTVSGRQTAVIDWDKGLINYADGSFESLL